MNTTIIFFIIFLAYFYIFRKDNENKEIHSISRESSNCLKGMMALTVVLHHLAQRTNIGWIDFLFFDFGAIAVGCFFFISGYGLTASYEDKGKAYLMGFPLKRFRKLIIPFLFVIILYHLIYQGETNILNHLTKGYVDVILPFSWYIFCAIFFYFIFYLAFKYSKSEMRGIMILFAVSFFLSVILIVMHWSRTWWCNLFMFPLGALVKNQEKYFVGKKNSSILYITFCIVFIIACILALHINNTGYILNNLAPLIYVLVLMIIDVSFKPLKWLGKISYEIYLVQGIIFYILKKFIHDEQCFIILSVISIIVLAYIVKYILNKLDAYIDKAFKLKTK